MLLGNVMSWDTYYLARQHPLSPRVGERLMKKVKPFCYFTERETAMYAILSGTPYYHEECPNSVGATTITNKELLNRLETGSRGSKRRFFDGFLRHREIFRVPESEPAAKTLREMTAPPRRTEATRRHIRDCVFCRKAG